MIEGAAGEDYLDGPEGFGNDELFGRTENDYGVSDDLDEVTSMFGRANEEF